jgi:hypothetical protein
LPYTPGRGGILCEGPRMARPANTPETRFRAYLEHLAQAVGHADRREPLRAYRTGACLPGERKSVEPMATRVGPRHVGPLHQSMHRFAANAPWEEAALLRPARDRVLPALERHGPVAAWIADDTGLPRRGSTLSAWHAGIAGRWGSRTGEPPGDQDVPVPVLDSTPRPQRNPPCRRMSSGSGPGHGKGHGNAPARDF